jgi:hypothetical protein
MGAMPGAKAEEPTMAAKNAMVRSIVTGYEEGTAEALTSINGGEVKKGVAKARAFLL